MKIVLQRHLALVSRDTLRPRDGLVRVEVMGVWMFDDMAGLVNFCTLLPLLQLLISFPIVIGGGLSF